MEANPSFDKINSVAAIYKKTKVLENVYIFRLSEIAYDADYDFMNDTLSYIKKNKVLVLPSMENGDFIDSDSKYCFSDYLEIEPLKHLYGTEDIEEVIKEYSFGLESFFRFGIKNPETGEFKIINIDAHELREKESDEILSEYEVVYDTKENVKVSLPEKAIKQLLDYIETGDVNKVIDILQNLDYDCENFREAENVELNTEDDEDEDYYDYKNTNAKAETIKETKYALEDLIGLDNVKLEIKKLKSYLNFMNKVKDNTSIDAPNLNMVFYGNPGTGKTTVARIIAKNLHDLGYTKNDKFGELTARSFIAGYVGQTAIKTRKVLDKYRGGVIFIDEAYVFNANAQEFADEALAEILKELEKHETVFIFAGYKDEMKNFINMNPGIESRIGYHLHFKDYTPDELYEIFKLKVDKCGLKLQEGVEDRIKAIIAHFVGKDKFSNGRFIDNLFQKILIYHADRTEDITDIEILTTIENIDINDSIKKELETEDKKRVIGY